MNEVCDHTNQLVVQHFPLSVTQIHTHTHARQNYINDSAGDELQFKN